MEAKPGKAWISLGFVFSSGLLHLCVGSPPIPPLTNSKTCDPCDNVKCSDYRALDCKSGYTLDKCKCCYQCANGEGELCGGSQNFYGACGIGLHCLLDSSSPDTFDEKIQRSRKCTSRAGFDNYKPPGVLRKAEVVKKLQSDCDQKSGLWCKDTSESNEAVCIPEELVCNGDEDCLDGSDESPNNKECDSVNIDITRAEDIGGSLLPWTKIQKAYDGIESTEMKDCYISFGAKLWNGSWEYPNVIFYFEEALITGAQLLNMDGGCLDKYYDELNGLIIEVCFDEMECQECGRVKDAVKGDFNEIQCDKYLTGNSIKIKSESQYSFPICEIEVLGQPLLKAFIYTARGPPPYVWKDGKTEGVVEKVYDRNYSREETECYQTIIVGQSNSVKVFFDKVTVRAVRIHQMKSRNDARSYIVEVCTRSQPKCKRCETRNEIGNWTQWQCGENDDQGIDGNEVAIRRESVGTIQLCEVDVVTRSQVERAHNYDEALPLMDVPILGGDGSSDPVNENSDVQKAYDDKVNGQKKECYWPQRSQNAPNVKAIFQIPETRVHSIRLYNVNENEIYEVTKSLDAGIKKGSKAFNRDVLSAFCNLPSQKLSAIVVRAKIASIQEEKSKGYLMNIKEDNIKLFYDRDSLLNKDESTKPIHYSLQGKPLQNITFRTYPNITPETGYIPEKRDVIYFFISAVESDESKEDKKGQFFRVQTMIKDPGQSKKRSKQLRKLVKDNVDEPSLCTKKDYTLQENLEIMVCSNVTSCQKCGEVEGARPADYNEVMCYNSPIGNSIYITRQNDNSSFPICEIKVKGDLIQSAVIYSATSTSVHRDKRTLELAYDRDYATDTVNKCYQTVNDAVLPQAMFFFERTTVTAVRILQRRFQSDDPCHIEVLDAFEKDYKGNTISYFCFNSQTLIQDQDWEMHTFKVTNLRDNENEHVKIWNGPDYCGKGKGNAHGRYEGKRQSVADFEVGDILELEEGAQGCKSESSIRTGDLTVEICTRGNSLQELDNNCKECDSVTNVANGTWDERNCHKTIGNVAVVRKNTNGQLQLCEVEVLQADTLKKSGI